MVLPKGNLLDKNFLIFNKNYYKNKKFKKMKKFKLVAIVAAALIGAAVLVTVQSCKKDQNKLFDNIQTIENEKGIIHPKKIEDMDAYLKSFGEKMLNSRDSEVLSLEEAAWHLTAYQNYRFGDVDSEYTAIVYEEKEYTVPVTNGMVTLLDLGTLYNNSAKDILSFYKGNNLDNKKILYVYSKIEEDGKVTMEMALTYRESSRFYYFHFDDPFGYSDFCEIAFPDQYGYRCLTEAPDTLEARMIQYGPRSMSPSISERVYYVSYLTGEFKRIEYPGRLYYCGACLYDVKIDPDEMCELLDSYLGLLVDNLPNGYDVVSGTVQGHYGNPANPDGLGYAVPQYHDLEYKYGYPVLSIDPPAY